MDAPLVSVGIPSYNYAPYLPDAIESVLGQTFGDLELVVADDGSTDGSLEVAQRYAEREPDRVTVVTHPGHANLGVGATASLYRQHMRGRLIFGMGADDFLYPDAVELTVDYLRRHPRCGYVYGYAHLVDAAGRRLPDARAFGADMTRGGRTVEELVQGNRIPAMALLARRECLDQAGPEDADLLYSDWEYFVRSAAHWDVGFIPRALAGHRVHGGNMSLGVTRAENVERAIAVTERLRERAPVVGGRLAEPRIFALIELQLGFLRFAEGDLAVAERYFAAAFERDPSLAADGGWLGDWLWSRPLDELLPGNEPEFVEWAIQRIAPVLEPGAARRFGRAGGAARAEARAIGRAREGHPAAAHSSALLALLRSPRRAWDRRLGAVLLDSIGGGAAGNRLRRVRRRLLRAP